MWIETCPTGRFLKFWDAAQSLLCLFLTDNVGKLCFLRLLWLLSKHHLYVCSGVDSAKHWNPNSAAGAVCWMKLECRGEAGWRLCLMCWMAGVDYREICFCQLICIFSAFLCIVYSAIFMPICAQVFLPSRVLQLVLEDLEVSDGNMWESY